MGRVSNHKAHCVFALVILNKTALNDGVSRAVGMIRFEKVIFPVIVLVVIRRFTQGLERLGDC